MERSSWATSVSTFCWGSGLWAGVGFDEGSGFDREVFRCLRRPSRGEAGVFGIRCRGWFAGRSSEVCLSMPSFTTWKLYVCRLSLLGSAFCRLGKLEITLGNMCLSIRCILRFRGVEHFFSQSSTKHPYYSFPANLCQLAACPSVHGQRKLAALLSCLLVLFSPQSMSRGSLRCAGSGSGPWENSYCTPNIGWHVLASSASHNLCGKRTTMLPGEVVRSNASLLRPGWPDPRDESWYVQRRW